MSNPLTLAYEHLPGWTERGLNWLEIQSKPWSRWRTPFARLRGRTCADGSDGSILTAGAGRGIDVVAERFFDDGYEREPLGWATPFSAVARIDRLASDDDLVLMRLPIAVSRFVDDRGFFRVPEMVDSWLRVAHPDVTLRHANQTTRRHIRRLRKAGFRWHLAHEPSDFERFYRDYYQPFGVNRFGRLAMRYEAWRLRRAFRLGGILWVNLDGETIVGGIFSCGGSVLHMMSLGTRDGSLAYHALDAMKATKLFAIDLARQRGFRWVNLGSSFPALSNGVFAEKRAWGGFVRISPRSHYDLLLRWPSFNARVARLLADLPLVVRDGTRLAAVACIPGDGSAEPAEAAQLWCRLAPRGLSRLTVVAPGGWATASAPLRATSPRRVHLADAGPPQTIRETARLLEDLS